MDSTSLGGFSGVARDGTGLQHQVAFIFAVDPTTIGSDITGDDGINQRQSVSTAKQDSTATIVNDASCQSQSGDGHVAGRPGDFKDPKLVRHRCIGINGNTRRSRPLNADR